MKKGFRVAAALTSVVCVVSGCDGVSGSDRRFVAATMPSGFDAFRMYGASGASRGRQACLAMIRTPSGDDVQESVVLERGSGMAFDLSATRDGRGWDIRSDGVAPTAGNSAVFRELLVDCVSTLEDKYRAEPADMPGRRAPLHR